MYVQYEKVMYVQYEKVMYVQYEKVMYVQYEKVMYVQYEKVMYVQYECYEARMRQAFTTIAPIEIIHQLIEKLIFHIFIKYLPCFLPYMNSQSIMKSAYMKNTKVDLCTILWHVHLDRATVVEIFIRVKIRFKN